MDGKTNNGIQIKNALYYFINYYKNLIENNDELQPSGIEDICVRASETWCKMSSLERWQYEELARKEMEKEKIECKSVIWSRGQSRTSVKEKRQVEHCIDMLLEIEKTIRPLRGLSLASCVFHLIDVNFYCEQRNGTIIPCEIAVAEFNLMDGVRQVYHTLINPGEIPLGYVYSAEKHSSETHQIPLPSTEINGETNFPKILNNIKMLLLKLKGYVPPLYTHPEDNVHIIRNVLLNFQKSADITFTPVKDMFRIYPLVHLFYELRNSAARHINEKGFPELNCAEFELEKDLYSFTRGMSCDFHEQTEAIQHCCMSKVRRWSYIVMGPCCEDLGIEGTSGQHYPKEADFSNWKSYDQSKLMSNGELENSSAKERPTGYEKPQTLTPDIYLARLINKVEVVDERSCTYPSTYPIFSTHQLEIVKPVIKQRKCTKNRKKSHFCISPEVNMFKNVNGELNQNSKTCQSVNELQISQSNITDKRIDLKSKSGNRSHYCISPQAPEKEMKKPQLLEKSEKHFSRIKNSSENRMEIREENLMPERNFITELNKGNDTCIKTIDSRMFKNLNGKSKPINHIPDHWDCSENIQVNQPIVEQPIYLKINSRKHPHICTVPDVMKVSENVKKEYDSVEENVHHIKSNLENYNLSLKTNEELSHHSVKRSLHAELENLCLKDSTKHTIYHSSPISKPKNEVKNVKHENSFLEKKSEIYFTDEETDWGCSTILDSSPVQISKRGSGHTKAKTWFSEPQPESSSTEEDIEWDSPDAPKMYFHSWNRQESEILQYENQSLNSKLEKCNFQELDTSSSESINWSYFSTRRLKNKKDKIQCKMLKNEKQQKCKQTSSKEKLIYFDTNTSSDKNQSSHQNYRVEKINSTKKLEDYEVDPPITTSSRNGTENPLNNETDTVLGPNVVNVNKTHEEDNKNSTVDTKSKVAVNETIKENQTSEKNVSMTDIPLKSTSSDEHKDENNGTSTITSTIMTTNGTDTDEKQNLTSTTTEQETANVNTEVSTPSENETLETKNVDNETSSFEYNTTVPITDKTTATPTSKNASTVEPETADEKNITANNYTDSNDTTLEVNSTTVLPSLKVESTTSTNISEHLGDQTSAALQHGEHSHATSGKSSAFLQPTESAAILAGIFVGIALLGYVGLLVWRRILEKRYGNREMLVNEDDFYDTNDLRNFEL
ncbi:hypothetical protein C0J52_20316 [Blattella germanica]|nr:hypothetical protein C0J52_20316 [Blattella germanica]